MSTLFYYYTKKSFQKLKPILSEPFYNSDARKRRGYFSFSLHSSITFTNACKACDAPFCGPGSPWQEPRSRPLIPSLISLTSGVDKRSQPLSPWNYPIYCPLCSANEIQRETSWEGRTRWLTQRNPFGTERGWYRNGLTDRQIRLP